MDSRLDSRPVWIMDDMDVLIEWFADRGILDTDVEEVLRGGSLSPDHRLCLWLDAHRKV